MPRIFPEFEDFFVGYGSYHDNLINKLIHVVCIPLISITLFMISFWFDTFGNKGETESFFAINLGLCLYLFTSFLYLNVDLVSGVISSIFYGVGYVVGRNMYLNAVTNGTQDELWKVVLTVHIVCWIAQFVGHGVFEKRAPALMDNLLLTLVAPDFVIIEVLFFLGWRKDVEERCVKKIHENIEKFREAKKLK